MTEPEASRVAAAPAIAIWIAASLLALVAAGVVFTLERFLGWGSDTVYQHDAMAVVPHAGWQAAATFAAWLAQAYLVGFYLRVVFPANRRWLQLSAGGAILAAGLAYLSAEQQVRTLREVGLRAVLDPSRTDPNLLFIFGGAAAVGILQAIALRPLARRFLAWPFVVVAAVGLGALTVRSLRPILFAPAITAVVAVAVAGLALGASFSILARPPGST